MKKLIISFLLMAICCLSASAQVEFSKFKLSKDEPFGAFPGRKMLNTKFKVTADRDLKYLLVDYYIVNAVGDVISGATEGFKNDTLEYIKPKRMECTGPFLLGLVVLSPTPTKTSRHSRSRYRSCIWAPKSGLLFPSRKKPLLPISRVCNG